MFDLEEIMNFKGFSLVDGKDYQYWDSKDSSTSEEHTDTKDDVKPKSGLVYFLQQDGISNVYKIGYTTLRDIMGITIQCNDILYRKLKMV